MSTLPSLGAGVAHEDNALNKWAAGSAADMGIGNCPGKNPDWTFAANATTYSFKRLRVLVRPK